jgi:predicted short-subunit dehydrogenase-like oxidoreductase (DUF2520 family)
LGQTPTQVNQQIGTPPGCTPTVTHNGAMELNVQTLNLIGCGRVGQTLARLWTQQRTLALHDVCTTRLDRAQAAVALVGAGHAVDVLATMRPAPLWMLAVPDAQLPSVAQALAQQQRHAPPALAFHCSGALDTQVLEPLHAIGWQVASAHCILSFASVPAAVQQFPGTPCALEGDAAAVATLLPLFAAIGAQCFDVASADKLRYHAAAVFATNFLPVLQTVAEDLWLSSGVPSALIAGLRASLLRNAVDNITRLGPQAALTGPAARGDVAAITRQAQALHDHDPQVGAAYEALSALALRIAAQTPATTAPQHTPPPAV